MTSLVETKEDVVQRLRRAREQLVALGVSSIGLFGSFVTGRRRAIATFSLILPQDSIRSTTSWSYRSSWRP